MLTMLQLQQSLNDDTNGIGWEKGITKQGKVIDWRRCIYLEAAELVESYPWKHWKNIDASVDRENIKVELVDIWHFIMSEALRLNALGEQKSIEALATEIEQYRQSASAAKIEADYYKEIELIESFIQKLFCQFELQSFIQSFFELTKSLGLEFNDLYALYLGKNILNIFRQDNGYKDGTYRKIWSGKEDNVVMQALLKENPDIDAKELYSKLQEHYLA